jgi:hypothetical protein
MCLQRAIAAVKAFLQPPEPDFSDLFTTDQIMEMLKDHWLEVEYQERYGGAFEKIYVPDEQLQPVADEVPE